MHDLATRLFPLNRSLTGPGVRATLAILQQEMPGLVIEAIPSGTPCFDWIVPREWHIRSARLTAPGGEVVVDFAHHNLHVVGYSIPVNTTLDLEALQPHLHSRPDLPDAIPYITSYYAENWGFCLPHRQRQTLLPGLYHAFIDSQLEPGCLNYAELVIPGRSTREVLISTYICHPSMANNELSGPVVATYLAKWVMQQPRRLTYRFVFIPETIGSLCYLQRHLPHLKNRVVAGFNITCVGDEGEFNYLPTRHGQTLSDRVARHVLGQVAPGYHRKDFRWHRGSDERQYNAPGIDLPIATITRSIFHEYAEYHTSLDDLTLVTQNGLSGSLELYRLFLTCLEHNGMVQTMVLGEPQLGRRGLYPNLSRGGKVGEELDMLLNLLAYADGKTDLLALAEQIEVPLWSLLPICDTLIRQGLLALSFPDDDNPATA
ncbi:MAG: DUF4910 domain-containing protein [Magnetococcales bacterium]|nr:DUF4910 domain-containing protein [Magnetococcales bacterium]